MTSIDQEFSYWFSNPMTAMVEGNEAVNESIIKRLHGVMRPFLLRRLHTKYTALHAARFSRANLVLAAGPYAPPADK